MKYYFIAILLIILIIVFKYPEFFKINDYAKINEVKNKTIYYP